MPRYKWLIHLIILLISFEIYVGYTTIKIDNDKSHNTAAAFLLYRNQSTVHEVVYRVPVVTGVNISVRLGHLLGKYRLQPDNYHVQLFLDVQRIQMFSKDGRKFVNINSICKFDQNPLLIYTRDETAAKCQIQVKHGSDKLIAKDECLLSKSSESTACYKRLQIDLTGVENKDIDYLTVEVQVVGLDDSKSLVIKGNDVFISLSDKLLVKWYNMDNVMKLGVPIDNLEIARTDIIVATSIKEFPQPNEVAINCQISKGLEITTVSFNQTVFSGKFKYYRSKRLISVYLTKLKYSSNYWTEKSINNLFQLHMVPLPLETATEKNRRWVSCAVERVVPIGSTSNKFVKSNATNNRAILVVNDDNFIIIPIMKTLQLFAIINEPKFPLSMNDMHYKIYSVHNMKDGSLLDITHQTNCTTIDPNSLACPRDKQLKLHHKSLPDYPNWSVLLSLMGWEKLFRSPIELWRAEDWRIVFQNNLNKMKKIKGWRAPTNNVDGNCQNIYQRTRLSLIGRLVMTNDDNDKIYYGESRKQPYPLLNFTPLISAKHVTMSNNQLSYIHKNSYFIIGRNSLGSGKVNIPTDITIRNDMLKSLAVERISVEDSLVDIIDMDVRCVTSLNVTQKTPIVDNYGVYSGKFRRMEFTQTLSVLHKCYLQVQLRFTDGTAADLMDYLWGNINGLDISQFRLNLQPQDGDKGVEDVTMLDRYIYVPSNYKNPGKFNLVLMESSTCNSARTVCKKAVDLFSTVSSLTTPSQDHTKPKSDNSSSPASTTDSNFYIGGQKVDTDSLYLGMKILIGLVALIIFIVVANCIIKFHNRKNRSSADHVHGQDILQPLNLLPQLTIGPNPISQVYTGEKLIAPPPAYLDTSLNNTGLLPPPGPFYQAGINHSVDGLSPPDIFWGLPTSNSNNINSSSNTSSGQYTSSIAHPYLNDTLSCSHEPIYISGMVSNHSSNSASSTNDHRSPIMKHHVSHNCSPKYPPKSSSPSSTFYQESNMI